MSLQKYFLVSSGDGTYFTLHSSSNLIHWNYEHNIDLTSLGCTTWAQYMADNTAYLNLYDTQRHLVRLKFKLQ
jgi:hypothetical protein